MSMYEHILDNQGGTVVDYLRRKLLDAELFRAVSAYFSIYGYELLAEELDRVGQARFLFGDPASVDELDPGEKEPRYFQVTETGLVPNAVLAQKYLALRCAEWVKREEVEVRAMSRSNFLHGKMYLADGRFAGESGAAVVGSSNFTRRGLGGGAYPNLEINLATTEVEARRELRNWFERLWNDERSTRDVKREVLEALGRVGRNTLPSSSTTRPCSSCSARRSTTVSPKRTDWTAFICTTPGSGEHSTNSSGTESRASLQP